ncbi:hypothetical protein AB0L13_33505 [Saccharopolyspora shandongensis]|uniref:hypothetical protein n=1 Tax=Saccharopolyspora shandongensis TaxID=418495 RepID=UPI00341DD5D5
MLTPLAVSQYLAANDWHLERQDGAKEIWSLSGVGSRGIVRVMLPMATDYADFQQRFRDLLHALGRIYDWDASQLQESIAATNADFFFVRLDQEMRDATIPFGQAAKSMEALYKMLKAAATSAADPNRSHLGKRPANVSGFLEDDLRLGHTKRGSFVFTIVSRLGGGTAPVDGGETSFPRKAMETLARGLETTRDIARNWDPSVLESPGKLGLSANLVESLEELAQPTALRNLELSFGWAAAGPPPKFGRERIVLDRDLMGRLPEVRERISERSSAPRRVALIGTVRSLGRDHDAIDSDGYIQLATEVNGKQRTVHVSLAGEHHSLAIAAYQRNMRLVVVGDLVVDGRTWRLVDNIHVAPEDFDFKLE